MVREFNNHEEATAFALEFYESFFNSLSESERIRIGMIQASGRYRNILGDNICLDEIERCFSKCPFVPYDIVAYRAGKMHFRNRHHVSASLLLSTAKRYNHHKSDNIGVHKIIIKKGTIILPLRALGKEYSDREAEIVISTNALKKRFGYYLYK